MSASFWLEDTCSPASSRFCLTPPCQSDTDAVVQENSLRSFWFFCCFGVFSVLFIQALPVFLHNLHPLTAKERPQRWMGSRNWCPAESPPCFYPFFTSHKMNSRESKRFAIQTFWFDLTWVIEFRWVGVIFFDPSWYGMPYPMDLQGGWAPSKRWWCCF